MKEITFANESRAREVALSMNKECAYLENYETRGSTYHRWIFSENAVVLNFEHGHGNKNGRFARMWLVKGSAYKVGRDETNLDFYNEKVVVK
ncbi:hypothetical protein [Tannerella forsythia]|uniref:hypothetical protein n=1 Tax=Tannerella forsythia TaxID=28112 RepID=UPI0028DCE57B|nr:hypothetical protein [Tannerella forsythia]